MTTGVPAEFDSLVDTFGEDPANMKKLHPELRLSLRVMPGGWLMIYHPLIVEIAVSWKAANDRFAEKKKQMADARKRGDWRKVLWLYERPYRLDALRDLWRAKIIDRAQLRDLLPEFWSDGEPDDGDRRWLTLWKAAAKDGMVTRTIGTPPMTWGSSIEVLRGGAKPDEKLGIAWTTDPRVAEFFALRYRALGVIFRGRISSTSILGYITTRNESEIIVDPALVAGITTSTVVGAKPDVPPAVVDLVRDLNERRR